MNFVNYKNYLGSTTFKKKYKVSVIVKNGIIYYNVIKICFYNFKNQFKYCDKFLCLDDNYEFDL